MTRAMRYLPPACAAVTGVLEIAFGETSLGCLWLFAGLIYAVTVSPL